jgi:hypothetical protein
MNKLLAFLLVAVLALSATNAGSVYADGDVNNQSLTDDRIKIIEFEINGVDQEPYQNNKI